MYNPLLHYFTIDLHYLGFSVENQDQIQSNVFNKIRIFRFPYGLRIIKMPCCFSLSP